MTHLYFIRHGESELNAAGLIAGSIETPLTKTGRAQAKAAGEKARSLGIEYIISSPLERARDTAIIFAQEIGYDTEKIEYNPMLSERHFGVMEGKPYTRSRRSYDDIEDAEKTSALLDRADRAVKYLESLPYKKILVVSHGSFGRALRHQLFEDQPFHMPLKYANAVLIEWPLLPR